MVLLEINLQMMTIFALLVKIPNWVLTGFNAQTMIAAPGGTLYVLG